MFEFELVKQINCYEKNKLLTKKWWETNVHKLALIALQTQIQPKKETSGKSLLVSFSLSIVSNQRIQELNSQYRSINKETDVLSFPVYEKPFLSAYPMEELELGDIFISLPKLKEQALNYNHSLEREAAFLFTHGFLHLLGYDHVNVKEEKKMFTLQDKILLEAGFNRNNPQQSKDNKN